MKLAIYIDENEIINPDKQEEIENFDSEEESNKKSKAMNIQLMRISLMILIFQE